MNLYNEIDPYAAEWLENLIINGSIADGLVDRRSIKNLKAEDLQEVSQFHAFAGIGVWSYALRLAGWPDDVPVWTGSCPCQPFSIAGKQEGVTDERHLWPDWVRLIAQCRPAVIFGEQVASPDGRAWLDDVSFDLEILGYEVGRADLCAAGVGAPHIRQRLFFCGVAHDVDKGSRQGERSLRRRNILHAPPNTGLTCGVVNTHGRDSGAERLQRGRQYGLEPEDGGACGMASTKEPRLEARRALQREQSTRRSLEESAISSYGGPVNGFWRGAEWIPCRDGKARPIEPGTFPLAHGAPARVGRLRAYGNAIVSEVAATFIASVMDILEEH